MSLGVEDVKNIAIAIGEQQNNLEDFITLLLYNYACEEHRRATNILGDFT